MKRIYLVTSLFLVAFFTQQIFAASVTITPGIEWIRQINTLAPGASNAVYNSMQINFHGGDTIYLLAGTRGSLRVDDLLGDSINPIVFCNKGGLVTVTQPNGGYFGISFNNSRYVKFTGKNVASIPYGILITQLPSGSALSLSTYSSNFEIEGLEVSRVASAGIVAKTDPNCANYNTYGNFVMYDLRIHHNYIHHTGNEGMYIGHTGYNDGNGVRLNCSNPTFSATIYPHKVVGVKIYQNICDSNGWDGIQVSSGYQTEIYDNYIVNDSWADVVNQESGIMIGQPTQANVYNNIIKNGKGPGIQCLGVGNKIFNNLIINPGNSQLVRGTYNSSGQLINSTFTYGIYVNDKVCKDTTVAKLPYLVSNNTIIIKRVFQVGAPYYTFAPQGINLNSLNYINGSYVVNNLVVIDSNTNVTNLNPISGIYASNSVPNYSISYSPNFISMNAKSTYGNNFYTNEINTIGFQDIAGSNYSLLASSPAVDAGVGSVVNANPILNKDLTGINRPQGSTPDFGALETLPNQISSNSSYLTIIPNPVSIADPNLSSIQLILNDTNAFSSPTISLVSPININSTIDLTIQSVSVGSTQTTVTFLKSQLPNQPGIYSVQLKDNGVVKEYANMVVLP